MRMIDPEERRVTTCEGEQIIFTPFSDTLIVPLKRIREVRYCEILNRDIPIHFRETFKKKEVFCKDEHCGRFVWVEIWQSQGVE